ncbi:hypothetical protein KSP40_PGU004911 [Platanthera guangdongensis]|uniref:Cytidyltransferase-like domain-containing protein n=1 Tax=Platanthera guangdongensis TaxID=2320717 RepID=A0ABR2MKZ8_9ASPA
MPTIKEPALPMSSNRKLIHHSFLSHMSSSGPVSLSHQDNELSSSNQSSKSSLPSIESDCSRRCAKSKCVHIGVSVEYRVRSGTSYVSESMEEPLETSGTQEIFEINKDRKRGEIKAIADTFKLSTTFTSDLHESEVPAETEMQFDEEQELEQIIDGKICMKFFDFSSGKTATSERKIILSGSFNPLHAGHLRLLDIASSKFASKHGGIDRMVASTVPFGIFSSN